MWGRKTHTHEKKKRKKKRVRGVGLGEKRDDFNKGDKSTFFELNPCSFLDVADQWMLPRFLASFSFAAVCKC